MNGLQLALLYRVYGHKFRPPTYIGDIHGVPVYYDPFMEWAVLGEGIINACVCRNTIFVNYELLKAPKKIQIGVMAHELGHIINGDLDPQINGLTGRHVGMEIAADKRAVQLTSKDDVLSYLYMMRNTLIDKRRKKYKWSDAASIEIYNNLVELSHRIQAIGAL